MDTHATSDSGLWFQGIKLGPRDTTLLCDISTGQPRPTVPQKFLQDGIWCHTWPITSFHLDYLKAHQWYCCRYTVCVERVHTNKSLIGKRPAGLVKRPRSSNILGPHPKFLKCHTIILTTFIVQHNQASGNQAALHHGIPSTDLVERFHLHLKTALWALPTGPKRSDALPWVLLGIPTAPKEDLKCSSVELVFGTPMTVPGDFIATTPEMQRTAYILPQLQDTVSMFSPTCMPTTRHGKFKLFMPPDLQRSDYSFICHDARHSTLQAHMDGPFMSLKWNQSCSRLTW